jgi:eukaryotic-like serine/threonine-protein kinase
VSGSFPTGETEALPVSLGRYEVLGAIASGGMATVYLARVTGLAGFEREVALKLTHAHLRDEPDFVTALMDEARLAGRIRHQNVVSVLDVDVAPAGVFIVMDYVDGDSLARLLRSLRKQNLGVPLGVALRIMDDTLAGLHAAHELRDAEGNAFDLVHRDVTPHNILLATDGVARLADFGIAKATARLSNTSTGLVKGKAAYMSPEQARGEAIDRRADVWAAGVVAWELITGQRLYEAANDAAILFKVTRDRPMRVGQVSPGIPQAIDDAVAKALEPNVEARFPSAEAFADALSLAADQHGLKVDHREVGRFFEPILTVLLDKRRARVREVKGLRKPGDPALHSNPSHAMPIPEGGAEAPTVPSTPLTGAGELADATQSGTGGVSAIDAAVFTRKPRSWLVGAAAGGIVVLVIGSVALWGSSAGQAPKTSSVPAAASAPVAESAKLEPDKPVVSSEPGPSESAAAPDASAAAPKPKAPPRKWHPTPTPPSDDQPVANPYK